MMQTLGLPPAAAHDKGRVNEQSLRGVERKKVNGGEGKDNLFWAHLTIQLTNSSCSQLKY